MSGLPWATAAAADEQRFPPELVFAAGERNHHIANTAYPIAHNSTWRPYRVPREKHAEIIARAFDGIERLCLYAHIPFCETRCSFCEYTVVNRAESSQSAAYMDWMRRELDYYGDLLGLKDRTIYGFDIGGGTPSFVEAELIAEFVEQVRGVCRFAPGATISIETTPRIAASEPAKLFSYQRAGIGRISMGVQVIQPDLLKVLNRDANGVEHHHRAVDNIRAAGFRKFNVDLMYGFAGQSLESWRATLEHSIGLAPEYITLYRMRYKLTRISHQASQVTLEQVREQAALAKSILRDAGYDANPGKNTYSRIAGDPGTSDYLTRRVVEGMPYLGLGLGAQSFTHTTISYNHGAAGKNLPPYQRAIGAACPPVQELYHLPMAHSMAKMIAVSFYFGEINRAAFHAKFGMTLEQAFPEEIAFLRQRELMHDTARAFSLTAGGARHFNGVIALFYAPSIQAYLLEREPIAGAAEYTLPVEAAVAGAI